MKKGYEIVLDALAFAADRHKDQKRKYTGEPYFNHLAEVAALVSVYNNDAEVIAAVYLHDSVEDVGVTPEEIEQVTTPRVSELVWWLTDSPLNAGNRKVRKQADNDRLWRSPPEVQTIKYADSISNTKSIVQHDPNWALHYLEEKRLLLSKLTLGNPDLYAIAYQLVQANHH